MLRTRPWRSARSAWRTAPGWFNLPHDFEVIRAWRKCAQSRRLAASLRCRRCLARRGCGRGGRGLAESFSEVHPLLVTCHGRGRGFGRRDGAIYLMTRDNVLEE